MGPLMVPLVGGEVLVVALITSITYCRSGLGYIEWWWVDVEITYVVPVYK